MQAEDTSSVLTLGRPVAAQEQGEGQAWAHQTFYIDPTWARPVLSFRYRMHVNDIRDYSDFFVSIQDGVGANHLATVLRDGYQPCGSNTAPTAGTDVGWRSGGYDLSAHRGQHVRLVFANRNLWSNSWGIWTHVDDVRVVDEGAPISGAEQVYLPLVVSPHCDFTANMSSDANLGSRMARPVVP
jgi:hypothetical protein